MHVSIPFSGLLLSALANVFNVEVTVALVQSNHLLKEAEMVLSPPTPVSDPEAGVQLESGFNAGSHGRGNHGPHSRRQVGILAVMADGSDT